MTFEAMVWGGVAYGCALYFVILFFMGANHDDD